MYVPDPAPTRITIDFSGSIHPTRAWIIGRVDERGGRVELLAVDRHGLDLQPAPRPATQPASRATTPAPVPGRDQCTCPEFCELDHANE